MDVLIEKFICMIFGPRILHLDGLNKEVEKRLIINSVTMIVFSHRYSKEDKFIIEAEQEYNSLVDFSIVRDVMYKYSKKAQDRYFS